MQIAPADADARATARTTAGCVAWQRTADVRGAADASQKLQEAVRGFQVSGV
jgi:hypothetical protein